MPKTNKKASMDVINILKSVMDSKVKPLLDTVDTGKRAVQEESIRYKQITSLIDWHCRDCYDRLSTIEAHSALSNYELQLFAIGKKIKDSKEAATELEQAQKFYKKYQTIKNATELERIKSKYKELEISLSLTGLELAKQETVEQNLSKDTRKMYEKYDETCKSLQELKNKINELTR